MTQNSFTADGNRWDYLGLAHVFERQDGTELLLYVDGDIYADDTVTDSELQSCREQITQR